MISKSIHISFLISTCVTQRLHDSHIRLSVNNECSECLKWHILQQLYNYHNDKNNRLIAQLAESHFCMQRYKKIRWKCPVTLHSRPGASKEERLMNN